MSEITLELGGLSCQNCVSHVSSELNDLAGVTDVSVALEPKGTSVVKVAADADITDADLRAAVAEAGDYEVLRILR